jgi:hypothetical protein
VLIPVPTPAPLSGTINGIAWPDENATQAILAHRFFAETPRKQSKSGFSGHSVSSPHSFIDQKD